MNTLQIRNILSSDCKISSKFIGVFPIDKLPTANLSHARFKDAAALVINLDAHNKPGSHWVCAYIDFKKGKCEYFDSFGRKPPKLIVNFFDVQGVESVIFNRNQFQNMNSLTCGYYCIYFLFYRCRDTSFSRICMQFDKNNTCINEEKVINFMNRNYENINNNVKKKHNNVK